MLTTPTGPAPRTWRGAIPISSLYTAGLGGTLFLRALKDRGELLATRCPACRCTYFPALAFCPRCLAELSETLRVKPQGELISFTRVHLDRDGARLEKPVAVAAVRLDGTDTVFIHYWLDRAAPTLGARVRLRLKPKAKRVGSILDIEGFITTPSILRDAGQPEGRQQSRVTSWPLVGGPK